MKKWPLFSSVKKALIFIVLIALIPAIALVVLSGDEHGRHLEEQVRQDAIWQVESLAEIQQRITENCRQLMVTIGILIEKELSAPDRLPALLESFAGQNPELLNITITDRNGMVMQTLQPISTNDFSDRKHIQDAIRSGAFSTGEYILARAGAVPSFPFSLPVLDARGQIKYILNTVYRLDSYIPVFEQLMLPSDSILGLVDHAGIRLFYHPSRDTNPVGQAIRGQVWQAILAGEDSGTTLQNGSDGISRFYAFRKLRVNPESPPYMYVVLAIPEATAREPALHIMRRNLLLMGLLLLTSIALAQSLGQLLVGQHIQRLTEAAGHIQNGNLDYRINLPADHSELSRVATAIDNMADSLSRQAAEQAAAAKQLERSLLEKETLLKEIHHRVKNNLQLILSLIHLQCSEENSIESFAQKLEGRVQAMSLIHELLYQSDDLEAIDLATYIERLVHLHLQAGGHKVKLSPRLQLESTKLPIDKALPLALLFNELLANALKHAGTTDVAIELAKEAAAIRLVVSDSGPGLPENFDPSTAKGLGMKLVQALTHQLEGSLAWTNNPGACFTVCIGSR